MNKTMVCSDERLRSLLQESDDSQEMQSAVEHLDHCSYCQSRIQEMAAELKQWDLAKDSLSSIGEPDATEHWYQAFQFKNAHQTESLAWSASMAKQLLGPPSHPEMLGRLGRYEVERLIGSGGMGIVFKAFDSELNRPVAIKVLAPYLAGSSAARKRFAREARAAAAIVHDHVVPIYNVETEQSTPFLVMQYIAGDSLQARIDKEGPLDVCEILRIGKQVASGLAAAHAQGLIHRDVKPSNIMLDENVSRALLTDFGLARAEDEAALTRSGFQPGTPHYMSPEQIRAEGIDGRSDLFSLGCVLYALCTGHPPFRAEGSYAVMRRITDDVPRSFCELNPLIPNWLEHIVMKLLTKQRVDRYQSAAEVADLLEGCLAHVQQPEHTPLPDLLVLDNQKRLALTAIKWLSAIAASLTVISIVFFWNAGGDERDIGDDVTQVPRANSSNYSNVQAPPAAPPINTLEDLVAVLDKLERSYMPYHIQYTNLLDPKAGKTMSESERGKYYWYDGRRHESKIDEAQLSVDHWFHKEMTFIDTVVQDNHQQYHTPSQEVSISQTRTAMGPNPTNEAQLHINTKPRIDFRIYYSTALAGIFPSIFMQSDLFVSKAIASHAVEQSKLTWDGDDAVLEFEYQPVPEAMRRVCKVWYSQKYGWHPVRFQTFFGHDRKTWHTEWVATEIVNQNGAWRIHEGTFTYHGYNPTGPLPNTIVNLNVFQISEAKYAEDAANTSMEYVIPEKVFINRDGVLLTNNYSGERRSIEVKVIDLNDQPIGKVSVTYTSMTGQLLQQVLTDNDGIAKTDNGCPETSIALTADGYRPYQFSMSSRQKDTTVRLLPKTTGKIFDSMGKPLANFNIVDPPLRFRADGLAEQDIKDTLLDRSDEQGNFVLTSKSELVVDANSPVLLIGADQEKNFMAITQIPAKLLGEKLQLVAKPVCRVSGSLLVPGNHTADEFKMWVEMPDGRELCSLQPVAKPQEDNTVISYQFKLPPGKYRLLCEDGLKNYKNLNELNISDDQAEYEIPLAEIGATEFAALVGKTAPELNVQWRSGDEATLAKLKGNVVVIDFWADWCAPCVAQMPTLIDMAEQYKDKPVQMIAVHSATQETVEGMNTTIDALVKYRWNKPLSLHAALDARQPDTHSNGVTATAYKVAEWPTVIVIKPDGTIYGRVTKNSLPQVIDSLLKD